MKGSLYETFTGLRRNYFKRRMLSYYKNTKDLDIKEIIEIIKKKNELNVFNYAFIDKYLNMKVEVKYDKKAEMYYVMESGRPLYFKRGMSPEEVIEYYKGISLEQDKESPHRYLTDEGVQLVEGDVVIDMGGGRRKLHI